MNNFIKSRADHFIYVWFAKLATIERSFETVQKAKAGTIDMPPEWRIKRVVSLLPQGVDYTFSTQRTHNDLKTALQKDFLYLLEKEFRDNAIPQIE